MEGVCVRPARVRRAARAPALGCSAFGLQNEDCVQGVKTDDSVTGVG